MSVLKANKIIGHVVDAGTKFTVDNDSTYIEGNSGKSLSFTQGAMKGFCCVQDMSDDTTGTTLNISSIADVSTGRCRYSHTNSFLAQKGYTIMPNDPSSGTIGYIYVDPGNLAATTTADSFLLNADNSGNDSKHSCGFGGELA